MPNAYQIIYDAVDGTEIKCNIVQAGSDINNSTIIAAQGKVTVEMQEVDNPFEILRPSTATIELEADTDNTFDELYSEVERAWYVDVFSNNVLRFRGWLSPDGIFEDYVSNAWFITLEARDGLADLSNKAYVDSDGIPYTGKERLRTILIRCLNRTGFIHDVRFQTRSATNPDFPVSADTDSPFSSDFFEQVINQRAFLSSDGKTALSCEEVIRNLLTGCNAYIFKYGAGWYVNWALQAANPNIGDTVEYLNYSSAGVFKSTDEIAFSATIGSHIKGFPIHWAGENQRIERRPSLGATRISFEFPELEFINTNPGLDNDGSTIEGWTVNSVLAVLNSDGFVRVTSGGSISPKITASTPLQEIAEGNIVIVTIGGGTQDYTGGTIINLGLRITNGSETYYLDADVNDGLNLKWITSTTGSRGFIPFFQVGVTGMPGTFKAEIESPPTPIEGQVTFELYGQSFIAGIVKLDYDFIGIASREDNAAQGVDHVGERIANPSSFIEDTQQVLVSDFTGSVYVGTLYRSDSNTVADYSYNRPTSAFSFSLYQTCVVDRLFIRSKPARVFEGDVYGFFDQRKQKVLVDNFAGVVWMPVGWRWDTLNNIISVKLWELPWTENVGLDNAVLDDINYEKIINYGNVIEPTIKG